MSRAHAYERAESPPPDIPEPAPSPDPVPSPQPPPGEPDPGPSGLAVHSLEADDPAAAGPEREPSRTR